MVTDRFHFAPFTIGSRFSFISFFPVSVHCTCNMKGHGNVITLLGPRTSDLNIRMNIEFPTNISKREIYTYKESRRDLIRIKGTIIDLDLPQNYVILPRSEM